MKRAEEYLKELFEEPFELVEDSIEKDFYDIIKRVQEETIRETVTECVNNAGLLEDGRKLNSNKYRIEAYNTYYIETDIDIDKQEILSVADKLIKEL